MPGLCCAGGPTDGPRIVAFPMFLAIGPRQFFLHLHELANPEDFHETFHLFGVWKKGALCCVNNISPWVDLFSISRLWRLKKMSPNPLKLSRFSIIFMSFQPSLDPLLLAALKWLPVSLISLTRSGLSRDSTWNPMSMLAPRLPLVGGILKLFVLLLNLSSPRMRNALWPMGLLQST